MQFMSKAVCLTIGQIFCIHVHVQYFTNLRYIYMYMYIYYIRTHVYTCTCTCTSDNFSRKCILYISKDIHVYMYAQDSTAVSLVCPKMCHLYLLWCTQQANSQNFHQLYTLYCIYVHCPIHYTAYTLYNTLYCIYIVQCIILHIQYIVQYIILHIHCTIHYTAYTCTLYNTLYCIYTCTLYNTLYCIYIVQYITLHIHCTPVHIHIYTCIQVQSSWYIVYDT